MTMVVSNPGGLWADYHHKTKTSALVIKLPSTVIKAIDLGAKVELHIALTAFEECYVALGLTVMDSSDSPLISITPATYINYFNGILHFAREGHTHVFIYNEMNHCILHGELLITTEFKAKILNVWSKIKQPYLMHDYMIEDLFIESILNKLTPTTHTDEFYEITLLTEGIPLGHLTKVLNMEYCDHGNLIYEMGEGIEGDIQEEQLAHSLKVLFGSGVYHSPWKVRDTQTKEFVDVFAISQTFNLAISSKAMSLYVSGFDKAHEKRLSTVMSHAREALNQLYGTLKSVKRNESILTFSERQPILFNRELPIHAIAIISEFLSPVDQWNKIADYVRDIHNKTGASVHVMDISEFKNVINLANGSLSRLEGILNQRFNGFLKHNILKIVSVDSSLQSTHPSEIFDNPE